jgi:hypothetical protein
VADYVGMTSKQLDEAATAWLKQHDKRPKERHEDGCAIEWQLTPVCAEVDGDDDAAEIAATFAELAGGRLATSMCAALSDEHHRGLEARREYMREARAQRPDLRLKWRARERERRQAKARALAMAAVAREAAHQQRREALRPHPLGKRRQQRIDPRQLGLPWAA